MTSMGIGLIIFIAAFFVLGMAMYFLVKSSGKRYIIAGKQLPFFLIGTMLLAQALDANATMGNASGVYAGGFWAGFQFPLGLALCLLVTGIWFAKPLNRMNLITLPDFYFRRYNRLTEFIVSLLMGFSFIILVAGNFAGSAWIFSIVFDIKLVTALFIVALLVFLYTIAGGLYACAATDIVQIYPAIAGFAGAFIWMLSTYDWSFFAGAIPEAHFSLKGLTSVEHGALLNWAGILALGLGDVVALDFMERIFAANSPNTARRSCFYGAALTIFCGIIASFLGFMGLQLFPEVADARMVLPQIAIATVPLIFGLFIMGGIVGAGFSTADGGILGVSSVLGRNILQRTLLFSPKISEKRKAKIVQQAKEKGVSEEEAHEQHRAVADKRLLIIARIMSIPVVLAAIWLAYVRPEPGILLVLAFDVVFAGCFVPLTLGIYWKKANTPGALSAVIVGSILRLVLFYTIPLHLAGLDTLIPPVVSLVVMVVVSLLTQDKYPGKHNVITEVPSDEEVLAGYK